MKAKPYKEINGNFFPCEPHEATHIWLHLPGPFPYRKLPVILKGARKNTPCWSWNGNTEKPTLKPSILTIAPHGQEYTEMRCHSFVNDGKVRFLDDCTHQFAGQIMDLLEVDFDKD